jgi:hypothetical protein
MVPGGFAPLIKRFLILYLSISMLCGANGGSLKNRRDFWRMQAMVLKNKLNTLS